MKGLRKKTVAPGGIGDMHHDRPSQQPDLFGSSDAFVKVVLCF
jgi:hypothetical protein